jgi:hypothetical protein
MQIKVYDPAILIKPEPVRLRLVDSDDYIRLAVVDAAGNLDRYGYILGINKDTGQIRRYRSIGHNFGFPLDDRGRIIMENE